MSSHPQSRLPRSVLVAIMVVPPIAVIAAMPWLKEQPDGVVYLVTGIAAALTIVASFLLGILHDRQIDEWHRSAARFSVQWGFSAGACVVALLLALPPVRALIVSLAANWADAPNPDPTLVTLAFTLGFMAVVVAQLVFIVLLSIAWTHWMSRSTHQPT